MVGMYVTVLIHMKRETEVCASCSRARELRTPLSLHCIHSTCQAHKASILLRFYACASHISSASSSSSFIRLHPFACHRLFDAVLSALFYLWKVVPQHVWNCMRESWKVWSTHERRTSEESFVCLCLSDCYWLDNIIAETIRTLWTKDKTTN